MALLVAEYDALMEAKSQNEWLMEQLRLLKKKQSGASSEQTKEPLDGQMSLLFNEVEAYTAPPGPQKTTQVAAHTRKQSGPETRTTPMAEGAFPPAAMAAMVSIGAPFKKRGRAERPPLSV